MSSRQEEKERRRQERLAQEEADARAAARIRRIGMALGGLIVVAAIVGIGFAIAGGGGSDKAPDRSPDNPVSIPPQKITNLAAAAHAAGCDVRSFPSYGREHVTKPVRYKTNPPTSGPHNPVPAEDGIYAPGNEPAKEHWVHSLEHGRVIIMYRPGTPKRQIDQLETLYNEELNGSKGYHQLVLQNNTKMPYAVAAVAWQRFVGCNTFNPRIFDAVRAFRQRFIDKGPEFIP